MRIFVCACYPGFTPYGKKVLSMRSYTFAKLIALGFLAGWFPSAARAHFGMIIPSFSIVMEPEDDPLVVRLSFSHPMEQVGMAMARPRKVWVSANGAAEDATDALRPIQLMNHGAWEFEYAPKRPGVYALIVEPEPYFEPAEGIFIIHYAKTYVAAFGGDGGWHEPVGLPTEIVPLTRPFGNYVSNVFQGLVLSGGKPVPHAHVEVAHHNEGRLYAAPNGQMTTQVVKADANGVFSYGVPFAGWWGFAALSLSDETMVFDGEEREVELGAVLWAEFVSPIRR